jgi:hypothetical protein
MLYFDSVVCRERDANAAWTTLSDGTLEQRHYYLQIGGQTCRW